MYLSRLTISCEIRSHVRQISVHGQPFSTDMDLIAMQRDFKKQRLIKSPTRPRSKEPKCIMLHICCIMEKFSKWKIISKQPLINSAAECVFLCFQGGLCQARERLPRVWHKWWVIGSARPLADLSPTCVAQGLTLFSHSNTLTSVCIFSILFSIHLLGCWQGEFV